MVHIHSKPFSNRSKSLLNTQQSPLRRNIIDNYDDEQEEIFSNKELELFLRQLSRMLQANISLEKSIGIIASGDAELQRTIIARLIHSQLRKGINFSDIFREYLPSRNAIFISLIKSGEITGNLSNSVAEMEKLLVSRNQIAKQITSSMIYPAILAGISMLSLVVILLYIIPQFADLLSQDQSTLPAAAKFVFYLSDSLQEWWWMLLVVLGAIVFSMAKAIEDEGVFGLVNKIFLIIPGFQDLPDDIQTSIISRLLGTLLTNGVKLVDALNVAQEATSDNSVNAALAEITDDVKVGSTVEDAFKRTELFSHSFLQMIRIGEESGDLGNMFLRTADLLEEEINQKIKRFLILIEPSILVVVGIVIGVLLYGLFSAILSVNNVAF